tara:strand:- start:302 stop:1204 length:903 start_codon:yes stop_codon:yes gene_type:complete
MSARDAVWAVQQYDAVRSLLPAASMPETSVHTENLEVLTDHFDVFLLDAFGVLNVGDAPITGATQRVQMLKDMGKNVLVLTNGACFPVEKALKKFLGFGVPLELTDIVSSRAAMSVAIPTLPDSGFWGVMSAHNSHVETLGIPWQRLENDASVYDAASGFLLLSTLEWTDDQQMLLEESITKAPRPVLVGNPDIVAPRGRYLSLEPGYYAHKLGSELKIQAKFFGKPFANIYDLAFNRVPNVDPSRVVMVGDTLHTDILGGAAYGIKTALVTDHGLFSGYDYEKFIEQTQIVPDFIMPAI